MSAPLFFVPAVPAAASRLVLDGAEGRHAATVRRIGVGERVDVADGDGGWAHCVVSSVGRAELVLDVLTSGVEPPPAPRFVLVQALAKGGRDELAVETATELGVDEVVPWQAARSVVQWRGERGTKARAGWESIARAAAKQSRRARVPAIAALASSADVRARIGGAALAVVLHEDADAGLAGMLLPSAGDVVLVVGPEGGITPDELELFAGAGALVCRLGPHVLRSSTAGPAAIAVLSAAVRWR